LAGTFRLGRLFGFEINVHWSWIFIFVLVTWTFASGILETAYPDWSDIQRWALATLIATIFFVSILLHELSHSVLATRYGIPVSSITLFVFGGVSNLTKEPDTARQEFWIAVVGPLTSIGIGVLLVALYFALRPIDEGASDIASHLALINIAIGIFNLVPGFPLDGGRVLRSIFWSRRRNILGATRIASNVGIVVAYIIMGIGVFTFFFNPVTGIWFLLIGNFLRVASSESYQQVFLDRALKGVPASAVARQDYVAVSPDLPLSQLVEDNILAGHGRCFPVIVGTQLIGLITLNDLKAHPREEWPTTSVYRAMTPYEKLRTVSMRDDVPEVLAQLAAGDVNQVPLVEGKELLGIIHRSDVLRYIQAREAIDSTAVET
jgi:Zn-dependent protease/CBS domain-containing protein